MTEIDITNIVGILVSAGNEDAAKKINDLYSKYLEEKRMCMEWKASYDQVNLYWAETIKRARDIAILETKLEMKGKLIR